MAKQPPGTDEKADPRRAGDGKRRGIIRRGDEWPSDERAKQERQYPNDETDATRYLSPR